MLHHADAVSSLLLRCCHESPFEVQPGKDETEEERMVRLEMAALAAEEKARVQSVSILSKWLPSFLHHLALRARAHSVLMVGMCQCPALCVISLCYK